MSDQKIYWRSLNERADNEEYRKFVAHEFPEALEPLNKAGRRRFMQLMGASVALASGCLPRWERQEFQPFTRRPETHIPGIPKYFRTAMQVGGSVLGLQVTSYDGRPIKIDGNPDHPEVLGASDAYAQASTLTFYDPDRTKAYQKGSGEAKEETSKADFLTALRALREAAKKDGGAKLRVLSGPTASPTLARLKKEIATDLPQAKWVEYDTFGSAAESEGLARTFGKPMRSRHSWAECDVIVALDADPLGDHPESHRLGRDWGNRRRPEDGDMNRVYAVEPLITQTGMGADHRLPLPAAQVPAFALALAQRVGKATGKKAPPGPSKFNDAKVDKMLDVIAEDLVAAKGRAVVMTGYRQDASTHALVGFINDAIGAVGKTVAYSEREASENPYEAVAALAAEMAAGKVDTLIIYGENPVYTSLSDVDFIGALAKVANKLHIGLYKDETAVLCDWHAPQKHFLASWGDLRSFNGTHTLQQPLIKSLYDGMGELELAAELAGQADPDPRLLVRDTFVQLTGLDDGPKPKSDADDTEATPTANEASGNDPAGNNPPDGAKADDGATGSDETEPADAGPKKEGTAPAASAAPPASASAAPSASPPKLKDPRAAA
ncbi:MAG: TAT-variant-translocated molybdopterin oxidoreductase, partial [Myxococcota bacterium]